MANLLDFSPYRGFLLGCSPNPENQPWHGRAQSLALTLPPLAAIYLAPA